MEKKVFSKSFMATYFAIMLTQNCLPQASGDPQSFMNRTLVIEACMDVPLKYFPQERLAIAIRNAENKTGRKVNPKARTVGDIVESLTKKPKKTSA